MRALVAVAVLIAATATATTADAGPHKKRKRIAVVVVIDHSGSMQGPKLTSAVAATRAAVVSLKRGDLAGVVTFDSEARVAVTMIDAKDDTSLDAGLATIKAGGGTNLLTGLTAAYDLIKPAKAKLKHVIVLSDGESPYDGVKDTVEDMRADGITVSCVGVEGADHNLLSLIADAGDGRLYMVTDLDSLSKVFVKETREATQ